MATPDGIVVFHDRAGGFIHKKFDYVKRIIYISKIDFSRMFAGLDHVVLGDTTDKTITGLYKLAATEFEIAGFQLVQGRFLSWVFTVPVPFRQRAARVFDLPGFFLYLSVCDPKVTINSSGKWSSITFLYCCFRSVILVLLEIRPKTSSN